MAQHITAVFPTEQASLLAEQQLNSAGYSIVERFAKTCPSPSESEIAEGTVHELTREPAYRDWALVVNAPFGHAARVIAILEHAGASETHESAARHPQRAAVVSDLKHIDDATIRSDDHPRDESFYVSSLLSLPLLMNNAAPLWRLLGLPVLIED